MVVDQTYDSKVLWKFVDVDGNALSNTAPVAVTRRTLTCNYQEFKTFTQQRIGVRSAASSVPCKSSARREECAHRQRWTGNVNYPPNSKPSLWLPRSGAAAPMAMHTVGPRAKVLSAPSSI